MADFFVSIFVPHRSQQAVEGYVPFRHVKAFLVQKLKGKDKHELMRLTGYRNRNKFFRRVAQWMELARPVPIKFLHSLGVGPDDFQPLLEQDQQSFQAAIQHPLCPGFYTVRLIPSIYQTINFAEGTTEEEAIECVSSLAVEEKHFCIIDVQGLRDIYCNPDGAVCRSDRFPSMEIDDKAKLVTFMPGGLLVGVVGQIGRTCLT